MTTGFRSPRALVALVVAHATILAAGCNQRTPILETDVVPTAPTVSTTTPPSDNISRIAFAPPGNRGGSTGRGTVHLDVPARAGRVVSLRSSDTAIVTVTPEVIIAEGALSADFSFTTRAVQRDVNVTITASSDGRTLSDYVSVWTATTSFFAYTADPELVNGGLVVRASSDAGARISGGCNAAGGGIAASASGSISSTSVSFAGPRGRPIVPGIYDNAVNTGGAPGNYLSIGAVQLCEGVGRVELHEVSLMANGGATSLWFTFEQRCLNKPGAIHGAFRLVVPGATPTATQCVR